MPQRRSSMTTRSCSRPCSPAPIGGTGATTGPAGEEAEAEGVGPRHAAGPPPAPTGPRRVGAVRLPGKVPATPARCAGTSRQAGARRAPPAASSTSAASVERAATVPATVGPTRAAEASSADGAAREVGPGHRPPPRDSAGSRHFVHQWAGDPEANPGRKAVGDRAPLGVRTRVRPASRPDPTCAVRLPGRSGRIGPGRRSPRPRASHQPDPTCAVQLPEGNGGEETARGAQRTRPR